MRGGLSGRPRQETQESRHDFRFGCLTLKHLWGRPYSSVLLEEFIYSLGGLSKKEPSPGHPGPRFLGLSPRLIKRATPLNPSTLTQPFLVRKEGKSKSKNLNTFESFWSNFHKKSLRFTFLNYRYFCELIDDHP